jgi:hypothetical protein
MAWCEAQKPKVYYCLGLARNKRLRELLEDKFALVRELAILCGGVARGFTEFQYQTLKSWTLSRRVIGKAEVLGDKDNPRFIVTNLTAEGFDDDQQSPDRFCAQRCARGNMENQIKQQYLDLDADRTSTHWMASNQLRLWFSAFALLLFQRLRTLARRGLNSPQSPTFPLPMVATEPPTAGLPRIDRKFGLPQRHSRRESRSNQHS